MKKRLWSLFLQVSIAYLFFFNTGIAFASDSDDGILGLFNFNFIGEAIRHSIRKALIEFPKQIFHKILGNWLVYLGWGLLIVVPLVGLIFLISYLIKRPKSAYVPINQINQPSQEPLGAEKFQGAMLYVTQPNGYTQNIPMLYDRMIIGRNPSCQIILEDHKISDQHAEIFVQEGRYFVRDLGSQTGTFVNGVLIYDIVEVFAGYYIQMGDSTIQL